MKVHKNQTLRFYSIFMNIFVNFHVPGVMKVEEKCLIFPNSAQKTIISKKDTPVTGNTTHVITKPTTITIGSSEDSSDDDVVALTAQGNQRNTPRDTSITSTGNTNLDPEKTHPHSYLEERGTAPKIIHTNNGTSKQQCPTQSSR